MINKAVQRIGHAMALLNPKCDQDILTQMKDVGLDPETAFIGGDWRGFDFSGLDIRGCAFDGADIRNCRFDRAIANHDTSFDGAWYNGHELVDICWEKSAHVQHEVEREYFVRTAGPGEIVTLSHRGKQMGCDNLANGYALSLAAADGGEVGIPIVSDINDTASFYALETLSLRDQLITFYESGPKTMIELSPKPDFHKILLGKNEYWLRRDSTSSLFFEVRGLTPENAVVFLARRTANPADYPIYWEKG